MSFLADRSADLFGYDCGYTDFIGGTRFAAALPLCLNVTFCHSLDACIVMRLAPSPSFGFVQQFAVSGRQILALATVEYVQYASLLLAQSEAHRIGVSLDGKAATGSGIPEVTARLQLFVTRPNILVPGSRARTRPSCAQGETVGKRHIERDKLIGHEKRAGQKSSQVFRGANGHCNGHTLKHPAPGSSLSIFVSLLYHASNSIGE
jgi:hypothetical protein